MDNSLQRHEGLSRAPIELRELLDRAPFGALGLSSNAGPYVVPVSFALDGDRLVVHGAPGRKSDMLADDPRISLSITDSPRLVNGEKACNCTFDYRSVLVEGEARLLTEVTDRARALRALVAKYHPAALDIAFDSGLLDRALVYAIQVRTVSVKLHQRPQSKERA